MSLIPGQGNSSRKNEYQYMDDKITSGKTYYYKLQDTALNGIEKYHGPIKVQSDEIHLDDSGRFKLFQNYPNPFNSSTKIQFYLPQSSRVNIMIYDISGREVKEIYSGYKAKGFNEVIWSVENITSGTYFYTIKTFDALKIGKMIYLK